MRLAGRAGGGPRPAQVLADPSRSRHGQPVWEQSAELVRRCGLKRIPCSWYPDSFALARKSPMACGHATEFGGFDRAARTGMSGKMLRAKLWIAVALRGRCRLTAAFRCRGTENIEHAGIRSHLTIALAFGLVIGIANFAKADTFTLTNDNGGDGYVTAGPGGGLFGTTLFGANNNVGANITLYSAVALSNQSIAANWVYSTADGGPSWDPAGFYHNGVYTQVSVDSGSNTQSGSYSFSVNTGDTYGIYVSSVDSCCGAGSLQISESAPSPVPGAGLLSYVVVACGGLAAFRRKLRAQATSLLAFARSRWAKFGLRGTRKAAAVALR